MRALLQRVRSASVTVDGACVGSIGEGLLVLLGVGRSDSAADVTWLVNKLISARLWDDAGKSWAHSLTTSPHRRVLIVSQFTLHGGLTKPKPSFHRSAGAADARALYDATVAALRQALGADDRVSTGTFGAEMDVASVNAGPLTLWLDSHNRSDEPWEGRSSSGAGDTAGPLNGPGSGGPADAAGKV